MAEDREVAGIRCMQVLRKLDDYVDEALSPDERDQVEAHLLGCEWCTVFGGRYASLVSTLRDNLLEDQPADEGAARRFADLVLETHDRDGGVDE